MSKVAAGWICFSLVVFLSIIINGSSAQVNGRNDCMICTLVLGVVEHLSMIYNESIVQSLDRFCSYLPSDFKTFCKEAVDFLGKFLIEMNEKERK
jgi:acyloxyacyl hydrolase